MAKEDKPARKFTKGNLPYYEDEEGYQRALEAYAKEHDGKVPVFGGVER